MAKVAYVTNAPPQSGMGKPARKILEAMKGEGFDTDFYFFDAAEDKITRNGQQLDSISSWPGPFSVKPLKWWRLSRRLPREKYDFWHLTNQTLSFVKRKPTLVTVYDLIELAEPQEKLGKWAAKYLYRGIPKAKHVICISEYTRHTMQEYYDVPDEKVSVIPLGVGEPFIPQENPKESVAFYDFAGKENIPPHSPLILYVGSDHPRKNLPLLAPALKEIRVKFPEAILIKIGDPGLKEGRGEFLRELEKYGVRDAVRFFGNKSDQDLSFFYNIADVFVFPSKFEGFGIPPLEAMACGTPVVSSNATSLPEVVGTAGKLVSSDSALGFAHAVIEILGNEGLRENMREKGITRAAEFSWQEIGKKTLQIYKKLAE